MKVSDRNQWKSQVAAAAIEAGQTRLNNVQREILISVLCEDKSFTEVGEQRQLTRNRVQDIFNQGLIRLIGALERQVDNTERIIELTQKNEELEKELAAHRVRHDANQRIVEVFESLPKKKQEILKTEISSTDLSARAKNACEQAGYRLVADLIKGGANNLLKQRNLGRKTLSDIEGFFIEHEIGFDTLNPKAFIG